MAILQDASLSSKPALGDIDGDGRDELCLLQSGALLCDTSRGGGTHLELALDTTAGALPLLGNFDGL